MALHGVSRIGRTSAAGKSSVKCPIAAPTTSGWVFPRDTIGYGGFGNKRDLANAYIDAPTKQDFYAAKKSKTAAAAARKDSGRVFRTECAVNSESIAEGDKSESCRLWNALIDAAAAAREDYEERHFEKARIAAEGRRENTAARDRRRMTGETWNYNLTEAAHPSVTRSKRGRAVAAPSKYSDSFVGAVAEAEILRVATRPAF